MIKLGYMTFVCPDWPIETVVKFARKANYDGVEIRVDANHKHEVSSKSTPETRRAVKSLFDSEGIAIPSIATSAMVAQPDAEKRGAQVDYVKANLDLAADLGAKVIRIFAGGYAGAFSPAVADGIAEAFDTAGEYAKGTGVTPMLECGHDIMKSGEEAAEVIRRVKTDNFCVLWNHAELDDTTYAQIRNHLRHFHVHDDALDPESEHMRNLVRRMKPTDFDGFICLEIIKKQNLPEDLLIETAKRIKGYIAEA